MNRQKGFVIAVIGLVVALATMSASEEGASSRALKQYYTAKLDTLHARMTAMKTAVERGADEAAVRKDFAACRQTYKALEPFIEYYYPAAALKLNGPPLPEAEPAEPKEPQAPSGFQVVEEIVYGSLTTEARLDASREIATMALSIERLQRSVPDLAITEAAAAEALRLNLYRLIAKGLSGFDAAVSGAAIGEAGYTLRGMAEVVSLLGGDESVEAALRAALRYLDSAGTDFTAFDRAHFIQTHLRLLQESLHTWRSRTGWAAPEERMAVRTDAAHLFAHGVYDPLAFAPTGTAEASPEKVALGRALFADARLSATGTRACISCHEPSRAFTDGKRLNETLAGGARCCATRLRCSTPRSHRCSSGIAELLSSKIKSTPWSPTPTRWAATSRASCSGWRKTKLTADFSAQRIRKAVRPHRVL